MFFLSNNSNWTTNLLSVLNHRNWSNLFKILFVAGRSHGYRTSFRSNKCELLLVNQIDFHVVDLIKNATTVGLTRSFYEVKETPNFSFSITNRLLNVAVAFIISSKIIYIFDFEAELNIWCKIIILITIRSIFYFFKPVLNVNFSRLDWFWWILKIKNEFIFIVSRYSDRGP